MKKKNFAIKILSLIIDESMEMKTITSQIQHYSEYVKR
jgi:hypothetical protein